jgi:hypothetical protein
MRRGVACSLVWLGLVGGLAWAQAPATYAPGQGVEVREGDVWSKASVVAREGRRYQIRYEDGTEEWVTADRLRASGSGGGEATPPQAGPANPANSAPGTTPPPRPRPAGPVWTQGQKVEVKSHSNWDEATITRRQGDWYLVTYSRTNWKEWVENWRIRRLNAKDDDLPPIQAHSHVRGNEGPPAAAVPPKPPKSDDLSWASDRIKQAEQAATESDPAFKPSNVEAAEMVSLEAKTTVLPKLPAVTPKAMPAKTRLPLKGPSSPAELSGLSAAPGAGVVLVGYQEPGRGTGSRAAFVERVDLAGGRTLGVTPLSAGVVLADVSDDGRVFVASSDKTPGRDAAARVELYTVEGNAAPAKKHALQPFAHLDWPDDDLGAALLSGDGSRLLVHNGRGRVVVFDTATGEPAWQADASVFGSVGLDSGRTHAIIAKDKAVVFVSLASGEVAGAVVAEGSRFQRKLLTTADNQRLISHDGNDIALIDLATGKSAETITLSDRIQSLELVGKDHLLINGTLLLDATRGAIVHRFERGELAGFHALPGGQVVFAAAVGRGLLTSIDLLSPAITQSAATVEPASQVALKKGDRVAVRYDLNGGSGEAQQKLRDNAAKQLAAAGLVLADDAPIQLTYFTKPGESREVRYRTMGPGMGEQTVNVTSQQSGVRIDRGGQTLWQAGNTYSGEGFVQTQGKSLEQALEESRNQSISSVGSIPLPTKLLLPASELKIGSSELTIDGVK